MSLQGWATSADQRRRKKEIEHYRDALKQILAERKRAAWEERKFRFDGVRFALRIYLFSHWCVYVCCISG